jgi:hypothetical protein
VGLPRRAVSRARRGRRDSFDVVLFAGHVYFRQPRFPAIAPAGLSTLIG